MRILVCVKRVPAPGAKINVTDDAPRGRRGTNLGFTTSPHEECALEESGADRRANTVRARSRCSPSGPPEAEEQLRYAASVGGRHVAASSMPTDGSADWDPQRTAAAITDDGPEPARDPTTVAPTI